LIKINKKISHNKTKALNQITQESINLNKIDIEGESKKIVKIQNTPYCLTSLKPTLYSYTFNRYGIVAGTDTWRYKLWEVFSDVINNELLNFLEEKENLTPSIKKLINELISLCPQKDWNNHYLTSFKSLYTHEDKTVAICEYVELSNQTPLEVVWKDYFIGTMKHNLLLVDKFPTKYNTNVPIEGKMPNSIVRFDWRNPFEHEGKRFKDEAIPDDFAEFWINVSSAKVMAKLLSEIINAYLNQSNYHLIDICYFLDKEGHLVFSEITPDGMRIKKEEKSFDKDLWRIGKNSEELTLAWSELYGDLKGLLHYE
jgi:phosphoribosylaminoimidazole-succinocarboxamide synthase